MLKHMLNVAWSAVLAFAAALIGPGSAFGATYTVTVVPQFPAVEIARTWGPILERVGAETGHTLKLQQYATIPEFEKSFLRGEPDLVYLNPYHMVMAAAAHHYVPLVRESEKLLSGILVVGADSPVHTLAGLAGQTLAFPSPNAFGASLYMRALLAQKGIAIKTEYVKTHTNAYRHVLSGRAIAAGGIRATLEREPEDVRRELRVLFETPSVPAHPLAAHPRMPIAVRQAVRDAVLKLATSDEGRALLAGIQMPSPKIAKFETDYSPLQRLQLERFVVRGEN